MNDRIRPFDRKKANRREEYIQAGWKSSTTLCQIMQARCAESGYLPLPDPDRVDRNGLEWVGFPWLTLILGSGCLELPENAEELTLRLGRGVETALVQLGEDDVWICTLTRNFTVTLAQDRLLAGRLPGTLHGVHRQKSHDDDIEEVSEVAALVTYAAALATYVFHEMGQTACQAMSRRVNDVVILPASSVGDDLKEDIERARDVLDRARDAVRMRAHGHERIAEAVANLLEGLRSELDIHGGKRVASAFRVRLLTEVAWYYLVDNTAVYPGWTDLLLRLMLSEGKPESGQMSRRPRPRYDSLDELLDVARKIMTGPTEAAWTAASAAWPGRPMGRQRLYQQAAEVLWAEAEANFGRPQLPPASVFVTTLDLEMEMALAATANDPFSIAVPIYVRANVDAPDAQFCWLLGDVKPPSSGEKWSLERLTRLTDWRVLGAATRTRDLHGRPIVVHLCGAPLIESPQLTDDLRRELKQHGVDVDERALLTPAITVDEYLAIRQSQVELSWLSRDRGVSGATPGRALPPSLTISGQRGRGIRYWLAMGVPFSDPAVRNRVLAQIGAASNTFRAAAASATASAESQRSSKGSGLGPRPAAPTSGDPLEEGEDADDIDDIRPSRADIFGVAVNLYIDDDEVALLHWLGLDVVEDSCHAFGTDLEHYVRHLMAPADKKRAPERAQCTIARSS